MPLFVSDAIPTSQIVRPGQLDQTGDINAAAVTEYGQTVQHTIARKSKLHGFIPVRPVRGTNTIGNFGFGESQVQKLVVGEAPAGTTTDIGRNKLTVDTVVLTRHVLPMLEVFQTQYDARQELGVEDGQTMAKFIDQAYFIQAAKAALLTQSKYSSVAGKPAGFKGGSVKTLAAAGDATDPAKLYAGIRDLFVTMENKDVVPAEDDIMLVFRPAQFYALQDAEQIINGTYITSAGTKMENIPIFKAFGCPVVSSNNLPTGVVANHHLSNAANGNAYDGDFSKLVGIALSPKALLAGETIPLEHDLWWNKEYKAWLIDSHCSFGVTPDRAEYAGAIMLP